MFMKKVKIVSPIVYYVAFFVINIFNAYVLTSGLFHPNISAYTSTSGRILSILGDFGVLLLLFTLTCLIFKKHKARCNTVLVITILLTLVVLFLTVFSNMFSLFFAFSQLSGFKNPVMGSLILEYAGYIIGMFKEWNMLIHFIPLLLFIILRFFINVNYDKKLARTSHKLMFLGNSLVFMIVPLVILNVNAKGTIHEVSMSGLYGSSYAGTYNYYLYSASQSLYKLRHKEADDQEREILDNFLSKYEILDRETNTYTNAAQGKNLVVLQLEAFNNFAINLVVDGKEITPNLNKLVSESYYNQRFYSTAGIGNTSDCEFSSLTGLYPNGNDLGVFSFTGKSYPSLAKDFRKEGYATFSIHGNIGEFYNRNVQHIETLGFDEHYDKEDIVKHMGEQKPEIFGDWLSDKCMLLESIKIFDDYDKASKNFFAYNILVTSHTPFIKNDKIKKLNLNGVTALAESCLDYYHYVDYAIGCFFDELKENYPSLYQNTVFVLYGDHTSSILKRDLESMTKKKYDDVQYRLIMQSVPFIIHNPELFSTKEIDNKVRGQVDIYPTMANLFGLENKYCIGADIFSDKDSLIYSPRSFDLIYDDYTILVPSQKIYYTNKEAALSKRKKETLIQQFYHYKYYNDMLLRKNYFK